MRLRCYNKYVVQFTFDNPRFAPWLTALAIPLLIALWERSLLRQATLPTLRFLLRATARQGRLRSRSRPLLLLILRLLLVLSIVLAFLQPALRTGAKASPPIPLQVKQVKGEKLAGGKQEPPATGKRGAGETPRVLLVTDAPLRPGSAAYYLRYALAPGQATPNALPVLVRTSRTVTAGEIASCDVILLAMTTPLRSEQAEQILNRVTQGGGLILFPAGREAPALLRSLSAVAPQGAFPEQCSPLERPERDLTLEPPLAPIAQNQVLSTRPPPGVRLSAAGGGFSPDLIDLDWRAVHLRSRCRLLLASPRVETLLAFSDQTPALVRLRYDAGRVLTAAFSPDPAAGDLVGRPLFPILVQEMVRSLALRGGEPDAEQEPHVGTPHALPAARPLWPWCLLAALLILLTLFFLEDR